MVSMPIRSGSLKVARLLAATSLTMSAALPARPAHAQDSADPPWRVGRLARIVGGVSTHGPGATDWVAASINSPLTSGDAIWTQPGAGTAMQVGQISTSSSTGSPGVSGRGSSCVWYGW